MVANGEPAASVIRLSPVNFRRHFPTLTGRLVSCYAIFKGWLLLSQPPSCLRKMTSFPTERMFRDLSWRSGLFPFRHMKLSPHGLTRMIHVLGIRSLTGAEHLRTRAPTSALPPSAVIRLYLNIFRREPAISGFDWHFTANHRSSPSFTTLVGAVLHGLLRPLQPAHG